jgi:hypothetical protein
VQPFRGQLLGAVIVHAHASKERDARIARHRIANCRIHASIEGSVFRYCPNSDTPLGNLGHRSELADQSLLGPPPSPRPGKRLKGRALVHARPFFDIRDGESRPRLVGPAMEISRLPDERLLRMPGSKTTRGWLVSCDDETNHLAFCWTENISAPNLSYAAQYLAYALPYQRFACSLTRMTRGRCSSLRLHRDIRRITGRL